VKLNNSYKRDEKQHYTAISKNKIRATLKLTKKETREAHIPEQICSFLINEENGKLPV
jgi:predicted nucleotidyltransferase